MAKFLIKAVDAHHADPTKDARGSYKRGDVVVVMPDNHVWGKLERTPKFFEIIIPGLPADSKEAQKYVQPLVSPILDASGNKVVQKRRQYSFLVSTAPVAIKSAIDISGTVTMSFIQMKRSMEDKKTGIREA